MALFIRFSSSQKHAHSSLHLTDCMLEDCLKCSLAERLCLMLLNTIAMRALHLLCRVVAVIRTYMTYVWGFGFAKPVAGLQPQTVGADEDEEGVRTSLVTEHEPATPCSLQLTMMAAPSWQGAVPFMHYMLWMML